jgi:DNA-binding phage protein
MRFLGKEVNAEKLLAEIEFVLKNSSTTTGNMSNGSIIKTDFGYVEDFFAELLSKGDFECLEANLKDFNRRILIMQKIAEEAGLSKEELSEIFTTQNLELAADVLASVGKYLNNLFITTNIANIKRDAAARQKLFLMNLLTILLGQAAAIEIDYERLFSTELRLHAIGTSK